jgi:hypothetical protein
MPLLLAPSQILAPQVSRLPEIYFGIAVDSVFQLSVFGIALRFIFDY